MNLNYLKSALVLFILILMGCEKEKVWVQNSKECFVGIEFKSVVYIEQIDMFKNTITVLNADGTYYSKEDWSTSKENKDTYNSVIGKSRDNNYDFHGTWQIIEPTSELIGDGSFDKFKPTYIKFRSEDGKEGIGYICVFKTGTIVGDLLLAVMDKSGNDVEGGEKVGVFGGNAYTDMKVYDSEGKEVEY